MAARKRAAPVMGLKQLFQKKYKKIEGLPDKLLSSIGDVVLGFIMIVWGQSANGKSHFMMQLLVPLLDFGKVLYVGLEEGFEATMQKKLMEYFDDRHIGRIQMADHRMTIDELKVRLRKRHSPDIVVIDSLQYWQINYTQYLRLKEEFPTKCFIFISHAKGKGPEGKVAEKIRYDAGIKVRVEGFVATIASRYGGNKPYIIWEDGAKRYWGKGFKKFIV